MRIMIVGSQDDLPRQYGWYYLRLLADISDSEGHDTLVQESPSLSAFKNAVKEFNPHFVIMNGHGGDRAIVVGNKHALLGVKGYSPELKITLAKGNAELMKGRHVYLFTCHTGKLLADALMKAGAKSVVAYDEPFYWSPDDNFSPPQYDLYAQTVFQSALEYPKQVVLGKDLQTAFRMMQAKYLRELDKTYDVQQGKYLLHNMKHLRKFGFGI